VNAHLLTTGEVDEVLRAGPLEVAATYAQYVRANGEVVPLSSTRALLPVDDRTRALAAGRGDRFFSDVRLEGSHVRALTVPTPHGAVQVARTVDDVDLQLLQVLGTVLLIGTAGVFLALVVGRLVAQTSLRPVRRLVADAEAMASTRTFSRRLDAAGHDELSRLAGSLNTLLEALEESLRQQRRLVADASHELKTPLTGLRTELDLLAARGFLPEADRAHAAVGDLVSAVDDLVELAHDRPRASEMDQVALDALVRECVDWARRHHRDATISVRLEPVTVTAVRSQVARAIGNLLDNALKHPAPGIPVEVVLADGVLEVRDHGPGIPGDDLPHVFERFYRATSSRSLPGAGLGLAIVRKVVDEHGWTVRAENAAGGGTRIVVDTRPAGTSATLTRTSQESHEDRIHSSR
jgi:two-component system sensor histidine kinase MprB